MHKDIIIGDANADTVARWIAAKVTEIQWSSDLSPTDTFTTERMGLEEPSRETWGYLIRLHGQINRHTPLTAGFATVAGISKVADVMRCEVRQGGGNRSQVVIDCEWYIVSHVQWLIDQMSVVFAIVQIEGDQVGDIKPGDAQNSTPQPAQVGAGDGPPDAKPTEIGINVARLNNVRMPTKPAVVKRWRETWRSVKGMWNKTQNYQTIKDWNDETHPALSCSVKTMSDIIRAGEAGLLDK